MSDELPKNPEDLNQKVEYTPEGDVKPIFIPESEIIAEVPLSRENLIKFIEGKNPQSPQVVHQMRIWLDSEKQKMGTGAESMESQVILAIKQARNYEMAGNKEAAMKALETILPAAEYDPTVDTFIVQDIKEMLEKKTTLI